jgi:hypothetical protein
MARLWAFIRSNGLILSDFSTDECVDREWARLVELRDWLSSMIEEGTTGLDSEDARALAADLASVMSRRSRTRYVAGRDDKGDGAPVPEDDLGGLSGALERRW